SAKKKNGFKLDLANEEGENDDPASSLICACQHLATYGVLTRGYDYAKVMGSALGASRASRGIKLFNSAGGTWVPDAKFTAPDEFAKYKTVATVAGEQHRYGPGTVYIYDPDLWLDSVTLYKNEEDRTKVQPPPLKRKDKEPDAAYEARRKQAFETAV